MELKDCGLCRDINDDPHVGGQRLQTHRSQTNISLKRKFLKNKLNHGWLDEITRTGEFAKKECAPDDRQKSYWRGGSRDHGAKRTCTSSVGTDRSFVAAEGGPAFRQLAQSGLAKAHLFALPTPGARMNARHADRAHPI